MVSLRKLYHFSWAERWFLLKALAVVTVVRLGLLLLPFRMVKRMATRGIEKAAGRRRPDVDVETYQARVVWAVRAVARRTLGMRPCLVQALATQWFLGRVGCETELCIGVVKGDAEALKAHAWLEREGNVIIGGRSSQFRYTPMQPVK